MVEWGMAAHATRVESAGKATTHVPSRRRPESGAFRFVDLVGRLDVIRVACTKCNRMGRYSLAQLIERHSRARTA
jgi:hypothetical protein